MFLIVNAANVFYKVPSTECLLVDLPRGTKLHICFVWLCNMLVFLIFRQLPPIERARDSCMANK